MTEVTARLRSSPESNLLNYAQILKILNVFAAVNFSEAEASGITSALNERF